MMRSQSVEPFSPYGIFSPSVESYQMTRCGNLLPSLYTGAMTFSLPLMTYLDPDFTIPVTLEYRFDGYKPGQHSGPVGYGWYLDCGGVITREVRGIPDEGDPDLGVAFDCRVYGWRQAGSYRDSLTLHSGSIYSIRRKNVDYVPVNECISLLEGYDPFSDTPMYSSRTSNGYNLYDTAPDIYHFRFLGHSGDFMMLPDGTVRVFNSDIPHGELSVEFTDDSNSPWHVVITITSADGYAYRFDQEDVSDIPDCNGDRPNRASKSVSAYHLTRITAPNGRYVSLSYTSQKNPVIRPRYGTLLDGVCSSSGVWEEESYYSLFSSIGTDYKWVFMREGSSLLDKVAVSSPSGTAVTDSIMFSYSVSQQNEHLRSCFERADESCFEWLGPPRRLTSVSMYGEDGIADSASLTYINPSFGTQKAFLHSVAGMKTGTYAFDYNLTGFILPPNDTQDTDHWGYWNGSSISDLRDHLVETSWMFNQGEGTEVAVPVVNSDTTYVVVLPDTTVVRRCASHLYDQMTDLAKEANASYSVCGALKAIHYPHGGMSAMEYEPNRVTRRMNVRALEINHRLEPVDSLDASASWVVGGVRVKSIVDTDRRGGSDTTRFSYTDPDAGNRGSGILMAMPKYAEAMQYIHRADAVYENHGMRGMAVVSAIGFNNCCGFTLDRDPHVVYPSVTLSHPDGSSTGHRFSSVADSGREDQYSLQGGLSKHIFGPSDWFEYNSRTPTCMVPSSLDCKNLRGLPLLTIIRDAQGREMRRTEYSYDYDQATIPDLCFNNILTFNLASYSVRSPLLVSTSDTERGVTVIKSHIYNNLGQKNMDRTICAGDTLEIRYRYIHESGVVSPSGYDRLLCDAARVYRAGGTAFLLNAEHYGYGLLHNPNPTRILSRVINEGFDVTGLNDGALFSVAQTLPARTTEFQYGASDHPHRITRISFTGGAFISYNWEGNHICSKSENGASNITEFDWKDLVGLTRMKYSSGLQESYVYDTRNRPWKILDADSSTVSVFHYNLKVQ